MIGTNMDQNVLIKIQSPNYKQGTPPGSIKFFFRYFKLEFEKCAAKSLRGTCSWWPLAIYRSGACP